MFRPCRGITSFLGAPLLDTLWSHPVSHSHRWHCLCFNCACSCALHCRRQVYIAYLDSVRYLRPLQARTPVYHELMCAYLACVRERGFVSAHIWACPPQRGDGYIFHHHPARVVRRHAGAGGEGGASLKGGRRVGVACCHAYCAPFAPFLDSAPSTPCCSARARLLSCLPFHLLCSSLLCVLCPLCRRM